MSKRKRSILVALVGLAVAIGSVLSMPFLSEAGDLAAFAARILAIAATGGIVVSYWGLWGVALGDREPEGALRWIMLSGFVVFVAGLAFLWIHYQTRQSDHPSRAMTRGVSTSRLEPLCTRVAGT